MNLSVDRSGHTEDGICLENTDKKIKFGVDYLVILASWADVVFSLCFPTHRELTSYLRDNKNILVLLTTLFSKSAFRSLLCRVNLAEIEILICPSGK